MAGAPVDAGIAIDGGAPAVVLETTDGSTCSAPFELPSVDEFWWEARWTKSDPLLVSPQCGPVDKPPTAPAVVARWVARHDGVYSVRSWSRDFDAVASYSTVRCGDPINSGCVTLSPEKLPAVPFPGDTQGSGADNVRLKAGDVWYFWFQNEYEVPTPEHGTGIVYVRKTSF